MEKRFFSAGNDSRKADGGRCAVSLWKRLCVLAVLLCACAGAMWGDQCFWNGGNGNWSDAANWNSADYPKNLDDLVAVETPGVTIKLTENITVQALSIKVNNNETTPVIIDLDGKILTISGTADGYSGQLTIGDWESDSYSSYVIIQNGTLIVDKINSSQPDTAACSLIIKNVDMEIKKDCTENIEKTLSWEGSKSTITVSSAVPEAKRTKLEAKTAAAGIPTIVMPVLSGTATTYTWVGGEGGSNLKWQESTNWSPNGIPSENDTAIFKNESEHERHTYTFTDEVKANIIELYRPAQTGLSNSEEYSNEYKFDEEVTANELILYTGVHVELNANGSKIIKVTGSRNNDNDPSASITVNSNSQISSLSLVANKGGDKTISALIVNSGKTLITSYISSKPQIKNNGTITGTAVSISASYITGSGDISVTSGTINLTDTTATTTSTIKNLSLGGGTFTAAHKVEISGNLTNTGTIALTSGDFTVTGTTTTSSPITTTTGNQIYNGDFTYTGTGNATFLVCGSELTFGGEFIGNNKELKFGTKIDDTRTVKFRGNVSNVGNFKSYYKTVFDGCESVAAASYMQLINGAELENDVSFSLTQTAIASGGFSFQNTVTGDGKKISISSDGVNATFSGTTTSLAEISYTTSSTGSLIISGTDVITKDISTNSSLEIRSGGKLTSDGTISIAKDFKNAGTFTSSGSGTVEFTGTDESIILGENTFKNLTCTAAGKTLKFEGGKTQTVEGKIKLTGDAGNLITLDSTDVVPPDTKKPFTLTVNTVSDTNVEIKNVAVNNSIAGKSFAGLDLLGAGCLKGTNTQKWFPVTKYTWIGKATGVNASSWDNNANWKDVDGVNTIPPKDKDTTEIIIRDSSTNKLVLDADITVKSITVDSGQSVDFAGNNVTATTITNNGTISGSGNITCNGDFTNASGATFEGSSNLSVKGTLEDKGTLSYTGTITFNGTSPQLFKNNAATSYPTVIISSDVNIVQSDGTTLNKLTVNDGKTLTAGSITVSDVTSINGTITTTGNQEYTGEVTLTGNATFTAANSTFSAGFDVDTYDVTIVGNADIYGSNTFNNFTCTTTGATLNFEGGETQTVNGVITLTGTAASTGRITLNSIDGSTYWKLEVPVANIDTSHVKITYVEVNNSEAINSFAVLDLGNDSAPVGTPGHCTHNNNTKKWFLKNKYTWIGDATETTWDKDSNWNDEDGEYSVPPKNISSVAIVIDGEGTLTLASTDVISVKSITVKAGRSVDFNGREVTTTDGISNAGTIRLIGTETITGKMKNVNDLSVPSNPIYSTIVYYGDCSAMPWDGDDSATGKQYDKLEFENTATGTVGTASEKIVVANTTSIAGSVTLENTSNTFGGVVTVSGGSPVLKGTYNGEVLISGGDNVSLSGTFNKTVRITGTPTNITLSDIFASGAKLDINVNSTSPINELALELKSDIAITGDREFVNTFTAKSLDSLTTHNITIENAFTVNTKAEITNCNLINNGTITSRGNFSIIGDLTNNALKTIQTDTSISITGDFTNEGIVTELTSNGSANSTVSITGTLDDSATTADWKYKGTINFNGSTDQTFTNNANTTYPKVTASNNLTVDNDFKVTTLKIESGKTVTTSKKFVLGSASESGTITGDTSTAGGILTLAGTGAALDIDATIYGTVDITSLTNAGTTSVSGTIKTSGDQKYTDKVTLIGDSTFEVTDTAKTSTFTAGFEGTVSNNVAIKGNTVIKGDNTFATGKSLTITGGDVEVTGKNTFAAISITKGNATFGDENKFDNLIVNNKDFGAESMVKFAAGKLQTIDKCKFTGAAGKRLILTTTAAATASSSVANKNDWWLVYFKRSDPNDPRLDSTSPSYEPTFANISKENFDYVTVKNSKSVKNDGTTENPLKIPQSFTHACETDLDTDYWFRYMFYWVGKVSSDWTNNKNWRYDKDEVGHDYPVFVYPRIDGYYSEIFVEVEDAKYDLNLGESVASATTLKLKRLIINKGKTLDLGKCSLDIYEEFANSGTVRLYGSQTEPVKVASPKPEDNTHDSDSTIEYYGNTSGSTISSLNLYAGKDGVVMKFQNLSFSKDTKIYSYDNATDTTTSTTVTTSPDFDISDKIEVAGKTIIKAGAGNTIAFRNEANIFTGEVIIGEATTTGGVTTITSGGVVTIASGGVIADNKEVKIKSDVYCDTLDLNTEVSFDEVTVGTTTTALEINTTKTTFRKNVKSKSLTAKTNIEIDGTVVFTNTGLFTTDKDKSITVKTDGTFTQNGTGNVVLGGSLIANGNAILSFGTDGTDVLATSATSDVTFGGGTNAITFGKNLIINYPFDQTLNTVASLTLSSPISVKGNFVLFNGTVVANKDLTVTGGDMILLGSDYKITDPKTNKINFVYNQYRGNATTEIARNYTATKLPDGVTDVPSLATEFVSLPPPANVVPFHGKFTAGNGVTIKAGKNFYANGIELSGSASWNLSVAKNSDASSFAEAYYCTVENSNAICNDGATDGSSAKVNAYECNLADLTKNDTNTNWDFEDFTITSANSISDSIVKVTFSSPARILSTTSNELYSTNHSVKYSKAAYDFTNVYADSTNENVAYFKVNDTKKDNWWKTDATGTDGGKRDSTDSLGNAHNNQANGKPVTTDLCFARITPGLTTDFTDAKNIAVLTTKWGKRINNYVEDPTTPATKLYYDGTTDGASPVLIYVHTGQETHKDYAGTPESQPSYDAHNFIEFVYSEPVDLFGDDGTTILASAYDSVNPAEPNLFENERATNSLGKIENSGNGILISGIAKIAAGRLQTGTGGTADGTVNAFYRKSGMNAHTLRISIAGYSDGTITDNNGNEYKKWIGYIDSAATPSGTVTIPAGNCPQVKDLAGNICNLANTAGLSITPPASPTLNDYGAWDVKKPSFAVYRRAKKAWSKDDLPESEAVGSTVDGTSSLKRIEFHLFDNEPEYNSSEPYQWVSRQGWVLPFTPSPDIIPDLYKDYSYAADVFGGSRPFDASPDIENSSRTAGGIRYSSVAESASAFKYIEESAHATPNKAFNTSLKAFAGAGSPVFQSITSPSRNATGADGLYFGLNFAETILSLRTHFLISYDSSAGYITDLAGNRLGDGTETITIRTKDLTPPSFNLTVAPVGQNKIYVMFNKVLNINNVRLLDENDKKTEKDALTDAYPNAFGLYELSANSNLPVEADITIDRSIPVKVLYTNEDYMGLEFTLTRDVTFEDIQKLYLVARPEGKNYKDPVIDVPTEFTTFIQDDDENYMAAYSAHALSDFAVDVINPLYAYNETLQDSADGSLVQVNLYGDGSNAVHDWNAEQQNYGTLLAGDEIHIISSVNISSNADTKFNPGDFKSRIYLDKTPDTESISVEYNRVTPEACNLRVWFPDLAGFSAFKSLSSHGNKTVEFATDGVSSSDYDFDFVIPKDVVLQNWQSGDQVTFMFDLRDSNNVPLTVVHTPSYDYETKKYNLSNTFPMFALRLKTPGDLTSLDLWSFKLKDQKQQRGGVTILNNVIDAGVGEKVTIKIDNASSGKVDVIVMTLDGNIIEYLNRGNLESGTHYFTWNGRNRNGNAVARGMYFVRVIGNGFDETRKVMVVK